MKECHSIEELMEAIELEIIESKLNTMRCLICNEDTLERVVGFLPVKPARPILFAVCELCQLSPGWKEEANKKFGEM